MIDLFLALTLHIFSLLDNYALYSQGISKADILVRQLKEFNLGLLKSFMGNL